MLPRVEHSKLQVGLVEMNELFGRHTFDGFSASSPPDL